MAELDPDVLDAYDYPLPPESIAQVPREPRDDARLLVAVDDGVASSDRRVRDLPDFLGPGDVVVVNETRVLPARLELEKPTGGRVEVLLLEEAQDSSGPRWLALVRPSRRVPPGTRLRRDGREILRVDEPVPGSDGHVDGRRFVTVLRPAELGELGRVALPPYIRVPLEQDERYQTVFARSPGSIAAPTAGLHFTSELLDRCVERGAEVATVDLAVGIGTFRPVTTVRLAEHRMHSEWYSVPPETMGRCRSARRVIAVGTTTVRALESAASTGVLTGRTDLFIRPGYQFRVVDVLMTNFHMPRSTLLVMLAAFLGPGWRGLYDQALERGYRFLSFGDAMIVGRRTPTG